MAHSPAYVLHRRPFRENSALVDFLTPELGRVRAVARFGRRKGGSTPPSPFAPLLIELTGRGELKTLRSWEITGVPPLLQGQWLYSAFYLNELLYRLLHEQDAQPTLFNGYAEAITRLAHGADIEPVLRSFELLLLDEMGYGIDLVAEADSHEPIRPDGRYLLDPGQGFFRTGCRQSAEGQQDFEGEVLLALAAGDFSDLGVRRAAKRLTRELLLVHLGPRPLQSRALFNSGSA